MEPQSTTSSPRGDAPLQPGSVLGGRYEIIEASDEATFGVLYRAKRRSDGQLVTIERLDSKLFGDQRLRAAVRREIEMLSGLSHKNLATPLDFGDEMVRTGQLTYVVMEHLDGQSLAEMANKKRAQGKPFSLKGAYNVIAHLANGLQALHEHSAGALHGGIAPRSVHVSSAGRVKVIELGVARALLAAGGKSMVVQSIPNLAPEAIAAPDRVDRRVDVFATGALLYELLTGQLPDVPPRHASTIVPGIPRALDVFIDTCLRSEAPSRYGDMARLKEALQGAVGTEATAAPQSAPGVQSAAVFSSAAVPAATRAPGPPATPPPSRSGAAIPAMPPAAPPTSRSGTAVPSIPGVMPPSMSQPQMPANGPPVPKSFNVDSALSSIDETHERWLVQKDKLDFGPFSLRDVKAQIEQGKILGDHTLVDTETSERRRVKDHPALRDLVMQSEAMHAENERLRIEAASRDKHRGRIVLLLGLLVVMAGAIGGGVFWYEKNQKAKIVVVKEPGEPTLSFDIQMKVDPPEKKVGGHHGGHGKPGQGGKNGAFDDSTTLGDASEGGGDETLDGATVQKVMTTNFKVLVGCVQEERHRNPSLHNVDMDFIIKGAGNVQSVKVNGQTSGPFANCMYGKMNTFTFPKFNGSKTHASFSLALK